MNINYDKALNFIQTDGNETLNAISYAVNQASTSQVIANAIGTEINTNECISLQLTALVNRSGLSSVRICESASLSGLGDEALKGCAMTISESGSSFYIEIAGVAGKTIAWAVTLDLKNITEIN